MAKASGTMENTGPLVLYSAFTGALAGLGVALYALLLKALSQEVGLLLGYLPPEPPGEGGLGQAFTGPRPPPLVLLLPLGFLLAALLGRGLWEPGWQPRAGGARLLLASLLQLSLYSPMGREGPFGLLGLGVGRALEGRFTRLEGLGFSGLAAGLGAAFHAPLAGALLAVETLRPGLRLEVRALAPALVGALSGFAVYGVLLGYDPLLPPPGGVPVVEGFPIGLLLGLLGALGASLWLGLARVLGEAVAFLPYPWRQALLGLALALALLLLPEALGPGLGWLALAPTPLVQPWGLVLLLLAKLLLLGLALGVGAYGGLLTPALVLGGLLGALLGRLLPPDLGLSPEALLLAGGAAALAGVARAPFAALLLATEWGGYAILPLVLPAVFVGYALTPKGFPLREGPKGEKGSPSGRPPQTPPPPPGPEAASPPERPPG